MIPPALAIFVKTPGLSPIKTRLADGIGMPAALHFHRLAAKATAEVVTSCAGAIQPYWAVAENHSLAFGNWIGFPCIGQGNGRLGNRLHRVHARLQERHGLALMIGSDIPQMTPALIRAAVNTLSSPEIDHVLGPASDGGFWLFGSKHRIRYEVWDRVPYSTASTAAVLQQNLAGSGRLEVLPTLTDIDTKDDLVKLRSTLSGLPAATGTQRELLEWLEKLSRS